MNYLILKDSLILNSGGATTNINRQDVRFPKILALIKEGKLDEIESLLDVSKIITDAGFKVVHGLVHLDNEPVPDSLSIRILDFIENELPTEPLFKFWRKLKANPSFNSRQQLFKFLEHNGHPITTEGNFIAYRAVREDFKDKHTGKMDNSIGNVVEIDRSQVDDNPNNTCSSGLHVATLCYAQGSFASGSDVVLDVEVDPSDVVAVPTDYNGTKMRVCKFKVVAITKGLRKESLVESSYEDDTLGTCDYCGEDDQWGSYCSNCGSEL